MTELENQTAEYSLPREIRMSNDDFKFFLLTLALDEEPNDKLKELAAMPAPPKEILAPDTETTVGGEKR